MKVNDLNEIPHLVKAGIIINVSTKFVTSLALLSSLKYLNIPLILIDCESVDGSYDYFTELMSEHDFYLMTLPLKKHGYTLDFIFNNIKADIVYLIDSDVEILNDRIINFIDENLNRDSVFGSGFVHNGEWLNNQSSIGFNYGYFVERMWIPFTCLKVSMIREALAAGKSFINVNYFNDFSYSQFISKALILRHRIFALRKLKLRFLNIFKREIDGHKPCYLIYDTGSCVYQFLKNQLQYYFVGIPAKYHDEYLLHYHGITRRKLNPNDKNTAVLEDYNQVVKRLQEVYHMKVPEGEGDC